MIIVFPTVNVYLSVARQIEFKTMNNREKILMHAENYLRTTGYNGFSFRDLAEQTGIKSASVHYHFPTKEHLVQALVTDYHERTSDHLAAFDGNSEEEAILHVAAIFKTSIEKGGRMCLCGMLASEIDEIPPALHPKVADYMNLLSDWLVSFVRDKDKARADLVVATLEGALIMARARAKPAAISEACDALIDVFKVKA